MHQRQPFLFPQITKVTREEVLSNSAPKVEVFTPGAVEGGADFNKIECVPRREDEDAEMVRT